ncbi:MAG: hypothetical protein RL571_3512 [Pseudomonadota bacterium]|jgi:hypothetical protein
MHITTNITARSPSSRAQPHVNRENLIDSGNRLFEKSVQRNVFHTQSCDLKSLLNELRSQHDRPSNAQAQRVQDALQRWETNHPKEVAKRGSLIGDLKESLAKWDVVIRQMTRQTVLTQATKGPQALLMRAMPGLEKLGSYACTDADTFVSKQNSQHSKIMERLNNFKASPERQIANHKANSASNMLAIVVARNGLISGSQLQNIAKTVDQAQAGCCSTLAYAAAAKLMAENTGEKQERVEVVSHRGVKGHTQTHCFVVLGRLEGSDLKQPETWGPDAIVVDPWAATIGAKLSGNAKAPPIDNLWPPTESVFDSRSE